MEIVIKFFGNIGRSANSFFGHFGRILNLALDTFYWLVVAPFKGKGLRWKSTVVQLVRIGYESLPIVCLISFFVGLILAMQSAYQLKPFGATIYVANLVSVSITREMAPILTAIIIAGRSGSAITAEIGTMVVSEEIDALKTMGLNTTNYLVVPKTLAMLIMLPSLTVIADFAGIFGGYAISMATLDIPSIRYVNQTIEALVFKDLFSGLVKSVFFAMIIAMIGCYEGFNVQGGAEGVGKSTTKSVVSSIFLIIAANTIFTALFFSV